MKDGIRETRLPVNWLRTGCEAAAVAAIYGIGFVLSTRVNLVGFLWMSFAGAALFFYFSISQKNLLDMRAILLGCITVSIGICQLRLSEIQMPWQGKTWFLHGISLICFCLGYTLFEEKIWGRMENQKVHSIKLCNKFEFNFQKKKVYYTTIFLAVMPIVLFCIQARIKGFIPIFVRRYDAYTLFYTRLSIFINLVIFSAPLAVWCLKNLELKRWQRIIMYAIIPLPTIIFQMMVQRGLFVWSLGILLVMVYFESRRKWLGVGLILCLLVFGVGFSSTMRGLSTDDMATVWKIDGNIEVGGGESTPKPPETEEPGQSGTEEPNQPGSEEPGQPAESEPSFKIVVPGFLYAPYYYIINGLENFNQVVLKVEKHSFGLKQFQPFTVVLRFQALKELVRSYPSYGILPNSTSCLISDFYYDFGTIGVVVEMLLLGLLSALIQNFSVLERDLFAKLEYGVFLSVYITGFFAAWFSVFGTWLFAGTAFLIFLYVYFRPLASKE